MNPARWQDVPNVIKEFLFPSVNLDGRDYFQVCCSLLAHSCCFVSVSCCANKGHKPDTVVLVKKTRYHCFDWFNAWVKSISYGEKFNYPLLYVV